MALLSAVLPGCMFGRADLLKGGDAKIDSIASQHVNFSRLAVYTEDDELVVYGKVGRAAGVSGTIEGHVWVTVLDPDGLSSEQHSATYPRKIPIRRSRKSYFVVRFPSIPRFPIFVRVQYRIQERTNE